MALTEGVPSQLCPERRAAQIRIRLSETSSFEYGLVDRYDLASEYTYVAASEDVTHGDCGHSFKPRHSVILGCP
jgi:hypothetical protein